MALIEDKDMEKLFLGEFNLEKALDLNEFYTIAGKALRIAVAFERDCKKLAIKCHLDNANFNIDDEIEFGNFINKFDKFCKSLGPIPLGKVIKKMEGYLVLDKNVALSDVISEAREARNFLVHDLLIEMEERFEKKENKESFMNEVYDCIGKILVADVVLYWVCIEKTLKKVTFYELYDEKNIKEIFTKIANWILQDYNKNTKN